MKNINKATIIRAAAAVGMAGLMVFETVGCMAMVQEPNTAGEPQITEEAFDITKLGPGDDFYGYVNAEYFQNAEIDMYGNAGAFNDLNKEVVDRCEEIIREVASGDRNSYLPGSNEQLIYDAYEQLYDYSTGENKDLEAVSAIVNQIVSDIENTGSTDELMEEWGELYKNYGVTVLADPHAEVDNENISEYCLVLYPLEIGNMEDLARGGTTATSLYESYSSTLNFAGCDSETGKERARAATYLLVEIAECTDYDTLDSYSDFYADMESYTQEEYSIAFPNTGNGMIFTMIGLDASNYADTKVELYDIGQWQKIDSLITDENLDALKAFTICRFFEANTNLLPKELGGSDILVTNDRIAVEAINNYLPSQVGELYAEKYYDEETVNDVYNMTMEIRDRYIELIGECEWLSDEAKENITLKLMNIKPFIGAGEPHTIDPADEQLIGATAFETYTNLRTRETYGDLLSKLGTQVVINGFENMAPQTVNACYDPIGNTINIPLAIMGSPFYSKDADYFTNLGAIGGVIGHEISHAFDSSGMDFDMDGRYNPSWIGQADRDAFDEMAQKVSDYYDTYTVLEVYHIDGELTLGENLADISSVECMLSFAVTDEDRMHVFEGWAACWCDISNNSAALNSLEFDVHSPARIRTNAVVALFDEFYEVYGVKEGDAMYVAPENRVTRWG